MTGGSNRPCGVSPSISDFVGNTPMMELSAEHEGQAWRFFANLEFMNPTGSNL